MIYKGYLVTDGWNELAIRRRTRNEATGVFLRRFGFNKDIRTTRFAEIDADGEWVFDSGAFSTEEYWGAPARLP